MLPMWCMTHKVMLSRSLLTCFIAGVGLSLLRCQEDETPPQVLVVENMMLKEDLQGEWTRTFELEIGGLYNRLKFDEDSVY